MTDRGSGSLSIVCLTRGEPALPVSAVTGRARGEGAGVSVNTLHGLCRSWGEGGITQLLIVREPLSVPWVLLIEVVVRPTPF